MPEYRAHHRATSMISLYHPCLTSGGWAGMSGAESGNGGKWPLDQPVPNTRQLNDLLRRWTEGDHLRHSKFAGLREDKDARTVIKEHGGEA